MQAALSQIIHAFTTTMQLELVESGGTSEQLRSGGELLHQIGNALAKGETARQFDKANQVATAPAAVTVEQTFLCVDAEGGMGLLMQRAESHELRPGADPKTLPVVPVQVFQQRNTLFESFEILVHGVHTPGSIKLEVLKPSSQPRMVGERRKSWSATQRPGPDDSQKEIERRPSQVQRDENGHLVAVQPLRHSFECTAQIGKCRAG